MLAEIQHLADQGKNRRRERRELLELFFATDRCCRLHLLEIVRREIGEGNLLVEVGKGLEEVADGLAHLGNLP